MELRRILTLMTFPQRLEGNTLTVNMVLIPRNKDPFQPWPTGLNSPFPTTVPGFADFQPKFRLAVVKGTDDFPLSNASVPGRKPILVPVEVIPSDKKGEIIKQVVNSIGLDVTDTSDKLPDPVPLKESGKRGIKKYLPNSYRQKFNFTVPRHPNAVTDDSYHCAVRDKVDLLPNYKPRTELSWGKVFAHILRQPLLAKACGMIYEVKVQIDPSWFSQGGYLYADLIGGDHEVAQEELLKSADGPLVKRYAAKIPALKPGGNRPVFAPVLFPVLYQKQGDPADYVPPGPWDELFLEAQIYNDGFAKVVHANQAVSGNLMEESPDGLPPQSDSGIRLAWDDEQILIWYLRQMLENPAAPESNERLDAPLGVLGYNIDVKNVDNQGEWESLNVISINSSSDQLVDQFKGQQVELPYQVYPTKIAGPTSDGYWLPMYYAYWIGKSLSTEDQDALEIYRNHENNGRGIFKAQDGSVAPNKTLVPPQFKTQLRYGNTYQFRVRLTDISGGGPSLKDQPINQAPSPETTVSFKRFVNPGMLEIEKPEEFAIAKSGYFNAADSQDSAFLEDVTLTIGRPLLEYPAVVFTDKYQRNGQDPIAILKSLQPVGKGILRPALPDPDVTKVHILVEVKSLRMDHLLSRSGNDSYIPLYTQERSFPANFEGKITLPVRFIDVPVLNLGEDADPFLEQRDLFDSLSVDQLVLPKGRHIRVSLRAVAESEIPAHEYFGEIDSDIEKDSRYGKVQQLTFYKETDDESNLLIPYKNIPELQALYLKPDPVPVKKHNFKGFNLKITADNDQPDVVKRLADALGLESKGLTLMAKKGERVALGCSPRIRHSMAPDGSSITFSTKADLYYHWITCLSYQVNRDWTWDGLQDVGFVIERIHRFRREPSSQLRVNEYLDDIELKHTVSFEAIQENGFDRVNRNYTRIIYIDALEPKNERFIGNTSELRYPDELWAKYKIKAQLKSAHGEFAPIETDTIKLPTTLNPSQTPKLVSVGVAFSPYQRAEDYSTTETRRRYLWVEFAEPIQSPDDAYFCRVLANAPDQLIARNSMNFEDQIPVEPGLSLDPEQVRRIIPGQSDDKSGLDAMQMMIPSTDSDRHFLVPLPPGLHPESPELFGFFTYEFRVGHANFPNRNPEDDQLNQTPITLTSNLEMESSVPKGNLWSTAQARFGRPIRVTGVQHPAPTLLCSLNRDESQMYVSAPFAKAVDKGKNVTSKPPRTTLWAILYAQVHQADGQDFRNILIMERMMRIDVRANTQPKKLDQINDLTKSLFQDISLPNYSSGKFEINPQQISMGALMASIKESHPVGTAVFTSVEIADALVDLGLPEDSPLSVLVVEVFGNITNSLDYFQFHRPESSIVGTDRQEMSHRNPNLEEPGRFGLGSRMGEFRILRTSPLTKVPFVCCPTCEK